MSGQLLFPNQFVHVLNQDSGEIRTEVGPKRLILNTNEKQLQSDPLNARIIGEDEYAVIKNPYDAKLKKNLMGEIEIREGPAVLCLNYNEVVEDVKKALILSKDQAVKLMATAETEGKPAGFIWQVRGECRFVPNKYTKILSTVQTILINENEGIYVRNVETSEKRLIRGPTAYLLDANEELYVKPYTEMETAALGLGSPTYVATVVKLKKGEVMCVLDAEKNEHILSGPLNYVLGPEEHVKTLYLSAGKPKRPKQIKVAKVKIGPDFMSDKFEVRTKDNANLSLLLTYKWQFLVGETEAYRVFSLPDFIGYSCTTLCSRIREEAAQYTFEEFHAKTVGLIRKAIFTDNIITNNKGEKETVHGLYFDEIKLLISEVDVRDVTPVNEEINSLLNQSIKSNMIIVCKRMEQEANLKSEKQKIQASAQIQKLREGLIDIQNENMSLEKIERAKIDGQVQILQAKSQKEAEELQSLASTKIQLDKMKSTIALLNGPGGDKYLELLRAEQIGKIKQQWYVASDSKYSLPLQGK